MDGKLRAQSSFELLGIYGSTLALIGLALAIILAIAIPTQSTAPSQCSAYGSLNCIGVIYSYNTVQQNANIVLLMSNSGSAPINVINANIMISTNLIAGKCNKNFVVPGQNVICYGYIHPPAKVGTAVAGQFLVLAQSCDSPITQFTQSNCSFVTDSYQGSFLVYSSYISSIGVPTNGVR